MVSVRVRVSGLQPLNSHYNRIIKQKWSATLSKQPFLGSSVSLSHDRFYLEFNSAWEAMAMKRGLILDAFAYCRQYPLRNTVKEHEYKKGEAFTDGNEFQQRDFLLLRTIVPSPKKISNPTYTKHSAHITSAENIEKLKEKEKIKKLMNMRSSGVFSNTLPASDLKKSELLSNPIQAIDLKKRKFLSNRVNYCPIQYKQLI